jgi:hypothetical protein
MGGITIFGTEVQELMVSHARPARAFIRLIALAEGFGRHVHSEALPTINLTCLRSQ